MKLVLLASILYACYGEVTSIAEVTRSTAQHVNDEYKQVERRRRVTWPEAFLGAAMISSILDLFVPWNKTIATAFVCVFSMLNYRAYHLEDEFKKILPILK